MPLQIRRGTTPERLSITPLVGEPVFDTDENMLYIGDGSSPGGVAPLTLSDEDAQDLAADLFVTGTHSGVTFTYNDAENKINAALNLNGTISSSIVPNSTETYDLGSSSAKFKNLYLSGSSLYLGDAAITSTGTAINLPAGSTIGGESIGEIFVSGDDSAAFSISSGKSLQFLGAGGITTTTVADDATVSFRLEGIEIPNGVVRFNSFSEVPDTRTVDFRRFRGVFGTPTVVLDNDEIYALRFTSYDGTSSTTSAQIRAEVDGAVSAGVAPGLLRFITANNTGVQSSALIIDSSQTVRVTTALDIRNATFELEVNRGGQTSNLQTFSRSRGSGLTPTVVQTDDHIYSLRFSAFDGTGNQISSQIRAEVAGTPTAGVVQGRLRFLTADATGTQLTSVLVGSGSTIVFNTLDARAGIVGDVTGSVFTDGSTRVIDGTDGKITTPSLTASEFIKFPVYADSAARDSAIPVPEIGMTVFVTDVTKLQVNTNGTTGGWVDLN
jgi:hypothetical protein